MPANSRFLIIANSCFPVRRIIKLFRRKSRRMDLLKEIFGEGKGLLLHQMMCRGVVIFFFTLVLIRISGRRSFGVRNPLDNIIVVLLGAILSRAVVGASPFFATAATSLIIVIIHRFMAYAIGKSAKLRQLFEGKRILLFSKGEFIPRNLRRALVCEEEVMAGVRKRICSEDLDQVDKIYMERNGEISTLLRKSAR